jgi:hypothetical protein
MTSPAKSSARAVLVAVSAVLLVVLAACAPKPPDYTVDFTLDYGILMGLYGQGETGEISAVTLNSELGASPDHFTRYSSVVIVTSQDQAADYPADVLVLWPGPTTQRRLNQLEWNPYVAPRAEEIAAERQLPWPITMDIARTRPLEVWELLVRLTQDELSHVTDDDWPAPDSVTPTESDAP